MTTWKTGRALAFARAAAAKGSAAYKAKSYAEAAHLLPVIEEIQASGVTGYAAIAEALSARGIPGPYGGSWPAANVKAIILRGRMAPERLRDVRVV